MPPELLMQTIEFHTGQPVPHAAAPNRLAQIDELCRRNIVIIYTARTGRVRRVRLSAAELAKRIEHENRRSPLLPINNPLGRGVRLKTKTFTIG